MQKIESELNLLASHY